MVTKKLTISEKPKQHIKAESLKSVSNKNSIMSTDLNKSFSGIVILGQKKFQPRVNLPFLGFNKISTAKCTVEMVKPIHS